MLILEVPRIQSHDKNAEHGYYIKETNGTNVVHDVTIFWQLVSDPTFFPGRAATIHYRAPRLPNAAGSTKDQEIGVIGILHPSVLEKFEIGFPCSALEISLELFKKEMVPVWINP